MNVVGEENLILKYKAMIESIKFNPTLHYNCEKNNFDYNILSALGFSKKEGTYLMHANVPIHICPDFQEGLKYEILQKGKHENIRCKIQNEVFRNDARMPLTIDDMFFDEIQEYYYDKGAIFLKKNDDYIGYGQFIIIDNIPTIVNIGILDKFRGRGYGKILMQHLMKILNDNGFKETELKVSSDNFAALNLYKSLGFKIKKEMLWWEYKK
jgi:ribosomal protein S18 acetylase RimI-like enzyme